MNPQALVDARTLSKLRWRCRRGLLENDLLIERFFERHEASLTEQQAEGLRALMDLADNDLLDLLLNRKQPEADLQRAEVLEVLAMLRVPGNAHQTDNSQNRSKPVQEERP